MNIKTGYLYHIKDEFFSKLSNHGLMINHENGGARPTYLTIKDNDILWFIPLSSKVNKYKKIINSKIKKHGIDLFFTNIDEIKKIMESELNNIMVTS